jgi:hypothetical protein
MANTTHLFHWMQGSFSIGHTSGNTQREGTRTQDSIGNRDEGRQGKAPISPIRHVPSSSLLLSLSLSLLVSTCLLLRGAGAGLAARGAGAGLAARLRAGDAPRALGAAGEGAMG